MLRLAWATDLHFEFATIDAVVAFCEHVIAQAPEALLLAGDVAQAPTVARYLRALDLALPMPIYFVLGNHDFYRGSIAAVRGAMEELTAASRHLVWMPRAGVVRLGSDTALIGHDGWADARCGDYASSRVRLNDYRLIEELTGLTREKRRSVLEQLGDQAAAHFAQVLPDALAQHRRVIALTHVPPFPETSWYQGRIADPDWLPHFCSAAVGHVFLSTMEAYPEHELLVLCGHTHTGGAIQVRPNLRVVVGSARYGQPELQELLEVADSPPSPRHAARLARSHPPPHHEHEEDDWHHDQDRDFDGRQERDRDAEDDGARHGHERHRDGGHDEERNRDHGAQDDRTCEDERNADQRQ